MSKAIAGHDVAAQDVAEVSEIHHLLAQDTTPWYRKKNLRRLYFCLVPAALGVEMTSGYDGSVLNGLQAVQPWQDYFNTPNGALLGVMTAAFSIGAVVAVPLVPYVNDRFGRKACVIVGSTIITVGAVLQCAAVNFAMFLVARIILGMGIVYAISGASQLISELAYPKERAVITGLFNESWYAGAIIAAGVTLGTFSWKSSWSWRLPSLLQLLPSTLQLVFIWFIPESPRFLVSRDRHEEALEILIKYHAEGDASSAFVAAEYQQIRETIRMELESIKRPWKEIVTTGVNRRRVLIAACVGLFSQWSGNGLVSYYLSKVLATVGITKKRTQNEINLGLSCWNLITGVTGALLAHVLPRRRQYLASYIGMTVMFACWTAASAVYAKDHSNHHAAIGVVALIFLYYGFYNLMMPLTYIFICEVFPFIHRSKGVAITQFFSRGGSAFNQFVNPIGLKNIEWRYYLVYVAWLAVESTIIFLLYPETQGPSLEEVAVVMEGDNAKVRVIEIGALEEKGVGSHGVEQVEKV
ncbi:Lactose permease [Exophiala dermatitidis]|uniref:MFS transporter, SP family, sugar:H+ symporter n=1 Tax=Exophiala dermatitidis (strain ATCC 34100 / CBS 525.76 / NIH/UT8656) TaxID=858893 RepID=H6BND4_EXODN|nr:MFS transporter, SP family, sugar:H+ symporter [Exophiala dermatitidis NIH/UT8656]EHY52204.1 MFS transporter, SP family, sugar:H+ symporter [Exophiala dermatitidis NIH/UT8656]KAJ4514852.1 hypothetical protein HRR75_004216 [Exophiala dermatitidis]KAJ4554207.1 hypothetical protein HRR78_002611 [Exophiala dermatitidis]